MAKYTPPFSSLIHTLKYHSVKRIAAWCGELLYMHTEVPAADVIVPVPLSRQRYRERGFNQAQEIGLALSTFIGIPCLNLLERTRHLAPQATITDQNKRKNRLDACFKIKSNVTVNTYSSVLLIDDVLTTGATLNQCAKTLKEAGIKTVHALALAHGN